MVKTIFEQFIIIALIVSAVLLIIFGSFLPMAKSQKFILAKQSLASVRSLDDFKKTLDAPLKSYSPAGDEEIIKFLSSDILNMIYQEGQIEEISRELVNYIEPYIFENNVRHLIAIGQMYIILGQKFKQKEDFEKAENYYGKAYEIGPKLPPVLYELVDLYRLKGDISKAQEINGIILNYWPDAEKIEAQ